MWRVSKIIVKIINKTRRKRKENRKDRNSSFKNKKVGPAKREILLVDANPAVRLSNDFGIVKILAAIKYVCHKGGPPRISSRRYEYEKALCVQV